MEAIQLAFIPSYALLLIGGLFYILIIFFIPKDEEAVEKENISMEEKTDTESKHQTIENLSRAEEGKISIEDKSANENTESPRVLEKNTKK